LVVGRNETNGDVVLAAQYLPNIMRATDTNVVHPVPAQGANFDGYRFTAPNFDWDQLANVLFIRRHSP
jgi:hypothetical protein